ncbi:MAG TPA: hypothetical protein VEU07_15065, partial [Candidatus Acidoferrum sp.]|nr:hypothetical protein [Candidatus Acidoferrum sp.]
PRDLGIPWLALKAVADGPRESLPEFLAGCLTPAGDLRWRGLVWSSLYGERRRVFRRLRGEAGLAIRSLKRNLNVALCAGSP